MNVAEREQVAANVASTTSRALLRHLERRPGDWPLFVLFVTPNVLLLAVFTYWPLVYNVYLSLMQWDLISPVKVLVGLENYRFLLEDSEFREVFRNTIVFTVGTVGGTVVLGLLFALLLDQPLRGIAFARGVV
ncbi:MAG: carbohydrate ABC transporter permease, partial [Thermomicrobium sp.]